MSENSDQQPSNPPAWGVSADDEADQSTTLAPRGWDGLDAATGAAPDGAGDAPDPAPSWGVVNDPGQGAPGPSPDQSATDPYGQPAENPFGQAAENPFGQAADQAPADPYAQPPADPYNQAPAPTDQFSSEPASAPIHDQSAPAQSFDQGAPAQSYDQGASAQSYDQGAPAQAYDQGAPAHAYDQGAPAQQYDQGAPAQQQYDPAQGQYSQPSAPSFDQQPPAQPPQSPYGQPSAPQYGGQPPAQPPPAQDQFQQQPQQSYQQPQQAQQPPYGQSAPQNFNEPQGYGSNVGQQPGQQQYGQQGQMQMPQYTIGQPPPGAEPQLGMGPTVAGQLPMTPDDEKLWSMLSHVGTVVLHFIAPLIVYFMYKDRSAFVKEQARRSLNWMIIAVGYNIVLSILIGILAFVGIGFLLTPLYWLPMVFSVIAGVKAYKGELYKYPVDLNLVK